MKLALNKARPFAQIVDSPWFPWVAMIFFVIANGIMKGWHLGARDLWLDEAYSVFYSQNSLGSVLKELSRDSNPPLYNIFLKCWISIGGISKVWVRIPSLVFNLISAALLFRLGKRYFNIETALIASVFFLISYDHLIHAHNTRSYAMSSVLCLASFSAYLDLFDREKPWVAVAMTLLTWGLIMCHYSNFLLFIGQAGVSLFYLKQKKKGFWWYWGSQIVALILFLPWVYLFYKNGLHEGGNNPFKVGQWGDVSRVPGALLANKTVWVAFLVVLIPGLIYFFTRIRKGLPLEERPRIFLLLGWSMLGLAIAWVLSPFSNFFEPQYLLILSFGFWLLLGYLISLIPGPNWIRWLLMIAFFITAAWDFTPKPFQNENWPKVISIIEKEQTPETYIGFSPYYQVLPLAYYYDQEIFSLGNRRMVFDELEKRGIDCLTVSTEDRERFLEESLKRKAKKIILVQVGYDSFDMEGALPRMIGEVYQEDSREEFTHTRVTIFHSENRTIGAEFAR